jgi:AraC-like DNA-binding protein
MVQNPDGRKNKLDFPPPNLKKRIFQTKFLTCGFKVLEEISLKQRDQLKKNLLRLGLKLHKDKKSILIEKIKNTILEMLQYADGCPTMNYSDYISEKLNYDYTYLANIFSEVKGITIQQYIILNKIERVKEFLLYDELNLTEISYRLHYSSVAHLSGQFKKVTGLSPSFYKELKQKREKTKVKVKAI